MWILLEQKWAGGDVISTASQQYGDEIQRAVSTILPKENVKTLKEIILLPASLKFLCSK